MIKFKIPPLDYFKITSLFITFKSNSDMFFFLSINAKNKNKKQTKKNRRDRNDIIIFAHKSTVGGKKIHRKICLPQNGQMFYYIIYLSFRVSRRLIIATRAMKLVDNITYVIAHITKCVSNILLFAIQRF